VSHPNKEILQIHPTDRFGCSSCHWGNGRATTSEVKGHGRHKFWLWPMFEKENTEAGCQQCHAKDRVTQGAETLNLGRDLFSQRGCVGCHRYEGFDHETDSLSATRQSISQLEDQITGNQKQIRLDENPPDGTSDEEAQKMLAQSEALKVTNSILAARIDQLNLQSKYLMQDQKKVGPNLKDVRLKLRKEWVPVWLANPQGFRPGTKMPTFWRFAEPMENGMPPMRDKDGQALVVIQSGMKTTRLAARLPRIFRKSARRRTSITSSVGFTIRVNAGLHIVPKKSATLPKKTTRSTTCLTYLTPNCTRVALMTAPSCKYKT
jgi:cytochrome c551/c552